MEEIMLEELRVTGLYLVPENNVNNVLVLLKMVQEKLESNTDSVVFVKKENKLSSLEMEYLKFFAEDGQIFMQEFALKDGENHPTGTRFDRIPAIQLVKIMEDYSI